MPETTSAPAADCNGSKILGRSRRIALVQFPPSGGLFQFSLQLGEALARGGDEVELITGPSPERNSREPTCRVRTILPTWHPTAGAKVPEWWRRVRRGLRACQYTGAWVVLLAQLLRTRPDAVVWSSWQFPIDGWGVQLARRALPRAVLAMLAHEPLGRVEQLGHVKRISGMTTRALARAYADLDVAFVLGESTKRTLIESWPNTPPVYVIPHGSSLVPSGPVPEADTTAPVVLSFGTITTYKGIDTLCKAWPAVRRQVPDAELVIAGALGADMSRSALIAEAAGLEGVSLRIGYVPLEEVSSYFARARCVVLPYKRSTQSGVAHLAHTLRRPVVASSVGDIPAVVHDGESGLLVPPNSPDALACALVELLTSPASARRMGDAGADTLAAGVSWDGIAARVSRGLFARRRTAEVC
jgi:glycosyltransferase involved in cell wall biosynthesis